MSKKEEIADKIIVEYKNKLKLFNNFEEKMNSLLKSLLEDNSIEVHSVTTRVKEERSLKDKIMKDDKNYTELSDITDIVGARIITYFSDDVDIISKIIEDKFEIDWENSVDKRKQLDPDRFGYLSLQYVMGLKSDHLKFPGHAKFKSEVFELQIRSILQHAWAEIEHDKGYKSKFEIPKEIRRQFSRLAALLEIGDSEFENIRDSLDDYKDKIETDMKSNIAVLDINSISLLEFLNNDELVHDIDVEMTTEKGIVLVDNDKDNTSLHIKCLKYFYISTYPQLRDLLEENKANILMRAKIVNFDVFSIKKGISLHYLYQVLIAKSNNLERIRLFLDEMNIGFGFDRDEHAEDLLKLSKDFT